MEIVAAMCQLGAMNLLLVLLVLCLCFGGGGFCLGGLAGGVIGLILLSCLVLHLTGAFRAQSESPAAEPSHDMRPGGSVDMHFNA